MNHKFFVAQQSESKVNAEHLSHNRKFLFVSSRIQESLLAVDFLVESFQETGILKCDLMNS